THGNLVANVRLLKEMFAMSAESSVVSWLPMYHDMGLVGTIILPVYVGAPCYKMSPAAFLQRPMRWLQAITRYRGRITAGPNFAYDLCVSKATPEVLAELDLSSWQVAVTGAEPVRAETMERFTRTFAPCGFKEATFHPSYGLAEATLIVSGKRGAVPPGTLAVDGAVLVSCGRPAPETTVRIMDAEDHTACEPGRVGEVWVSGPAVAAGYWQRTEETARTFGNVLDGQRYLRTGDLGFVHEGELYITGRLKDLMIIRGQNHYPQDVEWAVQDSHPAIRPGCCAAFSADLDGEERICVVAEVERQFRNHDLSEVVRAIRQRVVEQHGVQVYSVVLLRPATMPKTSSGKIQRQACKRAYRDGTLEALRIDINHRVIISERE
ncbi:MAG TPA: fatty acyl-AMP ligase, partial [Symbiobacteriaceae bacterium]|nr:fatty acyl-AMP ligase [Symbiobacteriaceae bacterium]